MIRSGIKTRQLRKPRQPKPIAEVTASGPFALGPAKRGRPINAPMRSSSSRVELGDVKKEFKREDQKKGVLDEDMQSDYSEDIELDATEDSWVPQRVKYEQKEKVSFVEQFKNMSLKQPGM
jgi:hypothetical protein